MTFTWLFGLLTCVYVRSGSGVPISLGVKVGSGDWRDTADGSPYPRLGGVAIAVYLASTIGVAPSAVEVPVAILAESDWAIVDGTGGDAELEHPVACCGALADAPAGAVCCADDGMESCSATFGSPPPKTNLGLDMFDWLLSLPC